MIIALLISLFLLLGMPMMGQNPTIALPADGDWPTIVGDSIMLIGPRQNELTEEQRYFNPPYLLIYPGKEHLTAQMIRAGLCDCDPTKPNRRIGVFSVAPDKKVSFSQGNLQYLPAIHLWKFANTQYEYLGNANKYLTPTFRNWVDLFGWSANNTTAPFGVSTSTNTADYAGEFVDWGTNAICGDAPNTWRTLTADEWEYLFQGRKNATQLYSKGNIDGLRGMIILPDNWVMPEGLHFTAQPTNLTMELDINTYTQAEWLRMEEAGAVFLCPTGRRDGTKIDYLEYYGGYWSSSKISNSNHVCHMYYNYKSKIFMTDYKEGDYSYGTNGRSVRLVHDTIVPETIPDPCLVVKVNDTLSINMMCVEGGTFMMGAMEGDTQAYDNEKPAHEVTLTYNYYIAQTEVTQALWKAVMGNNPSTMIGDDLPVNNVLWDEADAFVKRLSQMTGYTFHLPTEAEWEFAARGGKESKGYLYAGNDDVDEVAWYADNSGGKTHAVGTKKPNELGIYDMSGNAWEWCSDWLAPYSAEAQVNPIGPATGEYHVYRGGGWEHGTRFTRSSHRRTTTQGYVKTSLGLRVAIREKIEPEAVDLGLSIKWANFNIGAFDPTHYGDYFAWGETEPKETYSWANYKWCDGTDANMTKYNSTDGKTILESEDDAAQVHWGDDWRMPTKEEQQELIDRCSWERTNLNGVIGYKVTGPNGNSIFIPIAGAYNSFDNQLNSVGSIGWIYSSTIATEMRAYEIHIEEGGIQQKDCSRCVGLTIRPVYDDRPPKRIGVFSVAADKQVIFSQGNLQYIQSTDTWQFAREQYEYMGEKHYRNGQLADTIEYFGWSGKNSKAPWGISLSIESSDYAGEFLDWGTNTIAGSAPNTWRTLSNDEWLYICQERKNADQLLGLGTIGTVTGLIILPDDWQLPAGLSFTPNTDNATKNQYTYNQWAVMENAGAVFIATSGYFNPKLGGMRHVGVEGHIRTNALSDNGLQVYSVFETNKIIYSYSGTQEQNLQYAFAQRLVHDTIVPRPEPGRRIGVFSVAADKQVSFSQGNLQYIQSRDEWRFAENQYDFIGEDNIKDGKLANRIDLFGWSANNTTAPFGISTSTNNADYAGEFVDWGTNSIQGDAPNTWRTLSKEEWEYLIEHRANASSLCAVAQVAGVNGMILLPDNCVLPTDISFKPGFHQDDRSFAQHQMFTEQQWLLMEKAGAIFLPAAGIIYNNSIRSPKEGAHYQSSDKASTDTNYWFGFRSAYYTIQTSGICVSRSVRLVHDTIVPETIPDPCLVVKVNDTLSINMMCVEGGTFTMGKGENAHEVTLSDYYISECELTQAQWEAVMGEIPHNGFYHIEKYGDNYPMSGISLMECQAFVDKLNTMTDLHFRIPTEAEWEYAARGGKKSRGYTYAGSNNIDEVAIYEGTVRLDENGEVIYAPEPVMTRKPNELGIYDMSGNLCEWVNDWNGAYMHNLYPQINPSGNMVSGSQSPHAATENCPSTNSHTVHYVGGCWTQAAYQCEVTHKFNINISPTRKLNGVGLRLVLSDEEPFKMVYVDDTTRIVLRPVKGGTFMMGQDENAHEVTLSDYYMSECEVTQHLWKAVMGNIPTGNKNPSHPVGQVTYADCQDFITKLNNLTGLYFQLPTEAEWEYAAMGGNKSHGYTYSGSNTIDDVAWYDQNSENTLHNVGAKQPNELGIYDMSGNAWEWCADYYGPYSTEPQTNPQGPATGTGRVIRSGSFRTTAERCSNKHRQTREADYPDIHITFRLVLHDTEPAPEPEYVDLGLSVKWATFNVGATSPEDYGDYFAWGEIETKDTYTVNNYKWWNKSSKEITKYCTIDSLAYGGVADGLTELLPQDDVAHILKGEHWRMPNLNECKELVNGCTWTVSTRQGQIGFEGTSKINGNTIFLPVAGFRAGANLVNETLGGYWSSTLNIEKQSCAMGLYLNQETPTVNIYYNSSRQNGFLIRPVYDDRP